MPVGVFMSAAYDTPEKQKQPQITQKTEDRRRRTRLRLRATPRQAEDSRKRLPAFVAPPSHCVLCRAGTAAGKLRFARNDIAKLF